MNSISMPGSVVSLPHQRRVLHDAVYADSKVVVNINVLCVLRRWRIHIAWVLLDAKTVYFYPKFSFMTPNLSCRLSYFYNKGPIILIKTILVKTLSQILTINEHAFFYKYITEIKATANLQ